MTDPTTLREEIARLGPWHQDVEIAPGVRTGERPREAPADPLGVGNAGLVDPRFVLGILLRDFFPDGLEGRSLLDCACNAGGYLFEAKRAGAGRCFGFDVREHWIAQARFLARHLPSDGIELEQLDLLALPERKLEPFDVTFFFGLFYHLPDPVAGLRIAADLTRELIVVNTNADPRLRGDALTLNVESDTDVMSGVHRLAWLPTGPRVLEEILRWCGFPHTRVHFILEGARFPRIQIVGARDAKSFAHYDRMNPPRRDTLWKRAARKLLRR